VAVRECLSDDASEVIEVVRKMQVIEEAMREIRITVGNVKYMAQSGKGYTP